MNYTGQSERFALELRLFKQLHKSGVRLRTGALEGLVTTVENYSARRTGGWSVGSDLRPYCSFAYSALACFRMGMSGSASFQRAKKSW